MSDNPLVLDKLPILSRGYAERELSAYTHDVILLKATLYDIATEAIGARRILRRGDGVEEDLQRTCDLLEKMRENCVIAIEILEEHIDDMSSCRQELLASENGNSAVRRAIESSEKMHGIVDSSMRTLMESADAIADMWENNTNLVWHYVEPACSKARVLKMWVFEVVHPKIRRKEKIWNLR